MRVTILTVSYAGIAALLAGLLLGQSPSEKAHAIEQRRAAAAPVPAYSADLAKRLAANQAAVGAHAADTSATAAGITLRSVAFEVPVDGRGFPPGPGAELMAANCVACHTPGMILTQPKLSQADWAGEVTKMVNVYKAPVDKADVPAIVAYLADMKVGP